MIIRFARKSSPTACFVVAICLQAFQPSIANRSLAAEPPAKAETVTAGDRLGDRIVKLSPGKIRQLHAYLTSISAGPLDAKDDALQHIDTFKNLATFEMSSAQLTDRTLEKLKDLKRLVQIDLAYNDITDAGLQHLRGLDRLLFLNVYHTKVTKEAKAELMQTIGELRKQRDRK